MLVHGEAGNVRLAGIVVQFALARSVHAEQLALVAGAHVEAPIRAKSQRPDIARLGREELGGLARLDAIDLPVRRSACVDGAGRVHRDGEYLRLVGRPVQAGVAARVDPVHPAAVSGGGVQAAVRRFGYAPDHRLVGGKHGLHFGCQRKPAFPAQRNPFEPAADEIGVGIHLPHRGAAGIKRRRHCRRQQDDSSRPA